MGKASPGKGGGRGGQRAGAGRPKGVEGGHAQARAREEAFLLHYLADPTRNATAAAIGAGYTPETARGWASRILRRPTVVEEIRRRTTPGIRRLEITAERVLQGLAELGFANVLDFGSVDADGQFHVDLSTMDRVSAGAIASIETETYTEGRGEDARVVTRTRLKLADRRAALEALARHLRILGGPDAGQVQQPIRLVINYAPPARATSEPMRINQLIQEAT